MPIIYPTMSVQHPEGEDAVEERKGFFIEPEYDWNEEQDNVDNHILILQKADALASENRLKEAIYVYSMALRYGSVGPEQMCTLVDCILRNFKRKLGTDEAPSERTPHLIDNAVEEDVFDCPNCHRFLGEPVTMGCGHSYCKRCLQHQLLSKCKLCSEVGGRPTELKTNVILFGLLEKWFPEELKRSRAISEIEDLSRRKHFEEAVSLATDVIESDPGDEAVRWSRVKAYTGLLQYRLALEDAELCLSSTHSAEGFYWKAKVLQDMGQVDDSLQVFLHCLALDEDFTLAKREVENILCDLLSPAGENVKVGLRETAQSTSPHLRRKILVADAEARAQQHQAEAKHSALHQVQARTSSAHPSTDAQHEPGRSGSLERTSLSRAHSMRAHGPGLGSVDEGLKRVCSAPQLGDQEKGMLLKRKLTFSGGGPHVVYSHGSKHKKQGVACGASSQGASARAHRVVPRDLLDPNDLECSLCIRLFYEPVTTPCGHTFCKNCLERCLDHTPQCPLCKESLKEYLAARKYTVTSVLDRVIKQYLSKEQLERQKTHLEETQELADLMKKVPIFVCTMAYPTVPCPLHVFEPRYRLMIRRCMETGTRQFGMCINDAQKGFVDYGCMLIIRSVHFLPDGRSVVDTIGGKRFRVLTRGMKDGYCIADIKYLEDTRVSDSEELTQLQQLHDAVYEQARTWFQNLKNRFSNQILQHFGAMPEREPDIQATPNGPACCWWLLAVLPIDPRYQLSVLSMTTLRERLVKIQHILSYLQSIPNE
ncbi:LON peptidase N-terminal domain and RING finger protein 1-like isoform X2 [Salvelinus namaycush]|uniref:LON peptidase N-terminal domain and RING finger protein 1-like isoform X2 n=1 Tax=Salvelinus namaycush TaxID=8040 RepID=A0A8U0Q5U0_SALNM|nr:LON peptidase N-terminal domain and RING finger protein 1-like isoform X2 [Salvelinus namaycush]